MRVWHGLLLAVQLVLVLGLTYFFVSRGYQPGAGWTAVELVTIILAALALLITALGIFLAVLAIWGYGQIHEEARRIARAAVTEEVGKQAPRAISKELDRRGVGGPDYAAAAIEEGGSDSRDR